MGKVLIWGFGLKISTRIYQLLRFFGQNWRAFCHAPGSSKFLADFFDLDLTNARRFDQKAQKFGPAESIIAIFLVKTGEHFGMLRDRRNLWHISSIFGLNM